MDRSLIIPPGFRFEPSDEDVIQFYLKMKLNGESAPWDYVIKDCNIYGDKSPGDILREFGEDKSIWVFTKRNRVKSRFARVAGCGTWRSDQSGIKIKDNKNDVIGLKTTYSFRISDKMQNQPCSSNGENKKKERWMMYEYSLGKNSDFAICKIKKVDGGKGEDKGSVAEIRKTIQKKGQVKEGKMGHTGETMKQTSCAKNDNPHNEELMSNEFGGVHQQQSSSCDDTFNRISDIIVDSCQHDPSIENLNFDWTDFDFGEMVSVENLNFDFTDCDFGELWNELFPKEEFGTSALV